MLLAFFTSLRDARVPVSLREYLTLIEALQADLAGRSLDGFYFLARSCLVKDERNLDKFDRVFSATFKGLVAPPGEEPLAIPREWLEKLAERVLTAEEREAIARLGWDTLWKTLEERLREQKGRHEGGSKWIGTAGTSPFGAYGGHPEGIRIGQEGNRNVSAVKVWDKREFKDFDDSVELGTRTMKVALRRLRRFARTGAADELDLDSTIRETASHGYLDLRLRPERRNAIKVLLFLDVGGSMDWHVAQVEELFSAARSEFKHLRHFYFHNCPYEGVWTENRRRRDNRTSTWEVLRTYGPDYRVVFVGDASMSPYEIAMPGGSVEHWNEEAGEVWLRRMLAHFPRSAWINPVKASAWGYTHSIGVIRGLMEGRMFPLTLEGLDQSVRLLAR